MPDARGQMLGQDPEPAPHLEHHVRLGQLRGVGDQPEHVVVDEEVLAELAVGADAELAHPADAALYAHQPKMRSALRSTRASSSSYETPRSSASLCAVCTTFAGAFGFPRTGC